MLNDITRLTYENKAPDAINGVMRNPLLWSYQVWKGDKCEGSNWHPSLKWSANESKLVLEDGEDVRFWQDNLDHTLTNVSSGSNKRKNVPTQDHPTSRSTGSPVKRNKVTEQRRSLNGVSLPTSMIWDNINFSCSYDSLFTVLFNIWRQDILHWSAKHSPYSPFMAMLCNAFMNVRMGSMTLEQACDRVRKDMTNTFPEKFPTGSSYTYIDGLVSTLVRDKSYGNCVSKCPNCDAVRRGSYCLFGVLNNISWDFGEVGQRGGEYTTTEAMDMHISRVTLTECTNCANSGVHSIFIWNTAIDNVPDLIVVGCGDGMMKPDIEINIQKHDRTCTKLTLSGVIYRDAHHFTSRYVDPSGIVFVRATL